MTAFITARVKAVVALVVAAVVSYVATAIVTGTAYTLHGVEVAAATAVLTALGVHQAPANKRTRKNAAKDRGETFVWFVLVVLAACLGGLLAHLILRAM